MSATSGRCGERTATAADAAAAASISACPVMCEQYTYTSVAKATASPSTQLNYTTYEVYKHSLTQIRSDQLTTSTECLFILSMQLLQLQCYTSQHCCYKDIQLVAKLLQ